jgi:hypothetical protein
VLLFNMGGAEGSDEAANDSVSVGSSSSLSFAGRAPFTVEAWVRQLVSDGSQQVRWVCDVRRASGSDD